MNEKLKFILLLTALVIMIGGSIIGYNYLASRHSPEQENDTDKNLELAEDFTVYDQDGNEVNLSDYFGKPIVVNFWATWCGYCVLELPYFEDMYKEYGDEVVFMMVNSNEPESTAIEFIEDEDYSFPVYFDSEYSAYYAYALSSLPQTLFINKDGELANLQIGAMSESQLEKNIKELLD